MAVNEFVGVESYRLKRSIRKLAQVIDDMRQENIVARFFEDYKRAGRIDDLRLERDRLQCELARRWFGNSHSHSNFLHQKENPKRK